MFVERRDPRYHSLFCYSDQHEVCNIEFSRNCECACHYEKSYMGKTGGAEISAIAYHVWSILPLKDAYNESAIMDMAQKMARSIHLDLDEATIRATVREMNRQSNEGYFSRSELIDALAAAQN